MTESSADAPGRIFISYRRDETAYPAAWLYERLADHFGGSRIFKDVDSIQLGDDFVEVITSAVGSCDVLLALIGDQWLTITDEHGKRRLDDPDDFVRLEIEAALARDVRVVPILVEGAQMPAAEELPPGLAPLARRQALDLSPSRFDFDIGRLLRVLDHAVTPGHAELPSTPIEPVSKERRRLSTRARVLAAVGVTIAVIVLVIVVIVASSNTPQEDAVLFSDDFSGRDAGWSDSNGNSSLGFYDHDTYRVRAEPRDEGGGEWSTPRTADRVYPSAPSNIRIDVEARRIAGGPLNAYGILCRVDGLNFYALSAADDFVSIEKFVEIEPYFFELANEPAAIDVSATNRFQAACTSDDGGQSVHLVFSVNGAVVAEATDTESPLADGTVGLWAAMAPNAPDATEAEFDNFRVTEL